MKIKLTKQNGSNPPGPHDSDRPKPDDKPAPDKPPPNDKPPTKK